MNVLVLLVLCIIIPDSSFRCYSCLTDTCESVNSDDYCEIKTTKMSNPYIRSTLGRALYQKILEDAKDSEADHSYWYAVNVTKVAEPYQDLFIQCHQDRDTTTFLQQSLEKSESFFTQIYQQLVKSVVGWFISSTSVNGLLQRGSMFVFSDQQFQSLMRVDASWKATKLLDLGAGDGLVTQVMADHFDEVHTTEMSPTMQWRLQQKGFNIFDIDEWSNHQFDVITCLNLLDRCEKPVKLLYDMKRSLLPDGRIIVAVVLPFKPYVEYTSDHQPEQYLHIEGRSFEAQLSSMITDVFEPAGLIVTAFTRLPYLCEGDLQHSYYMLNDAVFVLKAKQS